MSWWLVIDKVSLGTQPDIPIEYPERNCPRHQRRRKEHVRQWKEGAFVSLLARAAISLSSSSIIMDQYLQRLMSLLG